MIPDEDRIDSNIVDYQLSESINSILNFLRMSVNDNVAYQIGQGLYTFDNPFRSLYLIPSLVIKDGAMYGHMGLEKTYNAKKWGMKPYKNWIANKLIDSDP